MSTFPCKSLPFFALPVSLGPVLPCSETPVAKFGQLQSSRASERVDQMLRAKPSALRADLARTPLRSSNSGSAEAHHKPEAACFSTGVAESVENSTACDPSLAVGLDLPRPAGCLRFALGRGHRQCYMPKTRPLLSKNMQPLACGEHRLSHCFSTSGQSSPDR